MCSKGDGKIVEGDEKTRLLLSGDVAFAFSFWQNMVGYLDVTVTNTISVQMIKRMDGRGTTQEMKANSNRFHESKFSAWPSLFDTPPDEGRPTRMSGTLQARGWGFELVRPHLWLHGDWKLGGTFDRIFSCPVLETTLGILLFFLRQGLGSIEIYRFFRHTHTHWITKIHDIYLHNVHSSHTHRDMFISLQWKDSSIESIN